MGELCKTCNKSFDDIYKKILSSESNQIKNKSLFTKLNDDLLLYINQFLYHDYHIVKYTVKSRKKPDHLEYDSDNEISGYYWVESIKICTKCFQASIYTSLKFHNRLPSLRKDQMFFRYYYGNMKLDKFFLPKVYVIDFYRQENPDEKNNFFFIKSNC